MLKANERRQRRTKRSPQVAAPDSDVYLPGTAPNDKKGVEFTKDTEKDKYSSSTQVGNRV